MFVMRNHLSIAAILLIWHSTSFCQYTEDRRNEIRRADSLKIENLKKQLFSLTGITLVDSLNSLAGKYGDIQGEGGFAERFDSVLYYSTLAQKEAKKISYKKGLGNALLIMAGIEIINSFKNKTNFSVAENYLQQVIQIGEQLNDNQMLGGVYLQMSKIKNSIENEKKAYQYFVKAGDMDGQALIATWLCEAFSYNGEYEEGVDYCQAALELNKISAQKSANSEWGHLMVLESYHNLSSLYQAAGDYHTAMNYFKQARQYAAANDMEPDDDLLITRLFVKMQQIDSALFYIDKFKNQNIVYVAQANFLLAEISLIKKDYDKTINILYPFIDTMRKRSMKNPLIEPLLDVANAYIGKGNYISALKYANEGTTIALELGKRPNLLYGYELLSKIFHQLGKTESAYQYLMKYINLKDSIQTHQFLWKLNNYKKVNEEERKTSQINLLNKDNQLKEQKLKQQAFVKNTLIVGLILLLLLGVFIFRTLTLKRKSELQKQKLENEKKQAELQQRATELEMQALRAQMNPHFIFNCLSSINKFILKNDSDTASDYLTRFSRLIRQSLTNSQLSLIPLSDEIEMLRLYLHMERLRFSETFTYNIIYENTIEPETIYIPPMLLQPFCENAIWHGLMHKEGQGKLEVIMSLQDGKLQCIIADNGIGREKSAALKSKSNGKQKSFGLKITTERLALFNNEKEIRSFCKTDDVFDANGNVAGTKVTLNIKYKNSVQQPVKETL